MTVGPQERLCEVMRIRDVIGVMEKALEGSSVVGIMVNTEGVRTGTVLEYLPGDRTVISFATDEGPPFFDLSPKGIFYSFDGDDWLSTDDDASVYDASVYELLRLLDPRFLLKNVAIDEVQLNRDISESDVVRATISLETLEQLGGGPDRSIASRLRKEGRLASPVEFNFAQSRLVRFIQEDLDPSHEKVIVNMFPGPGRLAQVGHQSAYHRELVAQGLEV